MDLEAWRAAERPNTRAFFLESPAKPLPEIIDIPAVAEIARAAGARLVVNYLDALSHSRGTVAEAEARSRAC